MTYKPVILLPAKNDIKEAAIWYNEQQPGLGKRFIRSVRNKVRKISANPEIYAVRYSKVRTAVVDIFPFMIHFFIDTIDKKSS